MVVYRLPQNPEWKNIRLVCSTGKFKGKLKQRRGFRCDIRRRNNVYLLSHEILKLMINTLLCLRMLACAYACVIVKTGLEGCPTFSTCAFCWCFLFALVCQSQAFIYARLTLRFQSFPLYVNQTHEIPCGITRTVNQFVFLTKWYVTSVFYLYNYGEIVKHSINANNTK